MSDPLFYAPEVPGIGNTVILGGEEAQHAAGSRRLHAGDALWLFDGRGLLARTTVIALDKRGRSIELRVEERRKEAAPARRLHLASALPKGDRQSVLLDMATQLGMTDFTPLRCERSVVSASTNSAERWARVCLSACKQSRRLFLPALHPESTPEALPLAGPALLAHPDGGALRAALPGAQSSLTLLVGPEGGFTESELRTFEDAGARRVSLGRSILRIESAAVAMLAAVQFAGERA